VSSNEKYPGRSDDENAAMPRGQEAERAVAARPASPPTIRPPVPAPLPPRPVKRIAPAKVVQADKPTPRRIATADRVRLPIPDDRPTPLSTVIPRLPPPPMRPRLETLIFHGAPPLPPASPLPARVPAALRGEAFQDVESVELLVDDEIDEEADRPTTYHAKSAQTVRPPPSERALPGRGRAARIGAFGAIAASVAIAGLTVTAFTARSPRGTVTSAASVAAPPSVLPAPPSPANEPRLPARTIGSCSLGGEAHLLARRALLRGGVEATALDDRLAFAALTSPKSGTAFELDARTLTIKSSAKVVASEPIRHVIPAMGDGAPVEADLDTGTLRTLADAEGESTVGVRDGFIVWGPRDGEATRLWRLAWPQAIEAPRVAALGTGGERVMALRRGGGIWVGSFRGGQTTSDLVRVSTSEYVGVPALDTRADEAVVAWAQRDTAASPWGVRWTRWTSHAGSEAVHELMLPPGGPGDRAMAPSVSALEGGRILLAWTETGHGKNQVRAQVFDRSDRPLGDALGVSPDDAVAGQEQIALADGDHGAIAYLVARRGAFELRATGIDCAAH
jgi:hypothetical protein